MPQGTIVDYAGFDPEKDSELLRKAMKGLGTDEKNIIEVVTHRSNRQRQVLSKTYQQMWGRNLEDDLKSELSKDFEDVILALFKTPADYDAWCLHDAMWGVGTTESTLIEIMCSRSNAEIKAIISAYWRLYNENLAQELQGETSGHFKRLLYSLAQASRNEDDDVDSSAAEEDAKALYEAGEKYWGTDESRFNFILTQRSFPQLALIFRAYKKISNKSLKEAIRSEFSDDIADGLLAVVRCAKNIPKFFARQLHEAIKDHGTNDSALIRIMVSRSEVDMEEIKEVFHSKYETSLETFIKDDTSDDYKKALKELCRGNK